MNRMYKIEYIKKHIDDVENRDSVDFIYAFIKGYIDKVWEKENLKRRK